MQGATPHALGQKATRGGGDWGDWGDWGGWGGWGWGLGVGLGGGGVGLEVGEALVKPAAFSRYQIGPLILTLQEGEWGSSRTARFGFLSLQKMDKIRRFCQQWHFERVCEPVDQTPIKITLHYKKYNLRT